MCLDKYFMCSCVCVWVHLFILLNETDDSSGLQSYKGLISDNYYLEMCMLHFPLLYVAPLVI